MVTIQSTPAQGGFVALMQMDAALTQGGNLRAYMRSKTMMEVSLETPALNNYSVSVAVNGGQARTTTYVSDPSGRLTISLKKYVQQAGDGGTLNITITMTAGGTTYTATASVSTFDGVSYADILAPKVKGGVFDEEVSNSVIVPPNVMLNPSQGEGIKVETNLVTSGSDVWSERVSGAAAALALGGTRGNTLTIDEDADLLTLTSPKGVQQWRLDKVDDCADIVCVRWLSLTGAVRQHYFHVTQIERGNDSETSMVTAGDGYVVRRSPYIGCKMRLQGLTPYSCWYYADMLQSSNVHAIIKPDASWQFASEIESEQSAAYVSGNAFIVPECNGFYTFEAQLKLKHYDTY